MAEIKRREKQEEKEAKARVLRQIEEDKIARRNVCILNIKIHTNNITRVHDSNSKKSNLFIKIDLWSISSNECRSETWNGDRQKSNDIICNLYYFCEY